MLKDYGRFIREFLLNPSCVGAIAPSCARLATRMVQWVDWKSVGAVAEYGPGTGVFTKEILQQKRPDSQFFAVELNEDFANTFAERFPDVTLFRDSVGNIEQICQQQNVDQLDAVICGLPWATFSDDLQTELLEAMLKVLKPGGYFATFAYLSGMALPAAHRFHRKLEGLFDQVEPSRTVWTNVLPAFVYQCRL